jgi:hypothetical protein
MLISPLNVPARCVGIIYILILRSALKTNIVPSGMINFVVAD